MRMNISFSTNISFYFFLGKNWACLIDIILLLLLLRRAIIIFSSDLYSSNFCYSVLCFPFLFLQLNIFKEIIKLIKSHHKFKIDITQIINRHIQILKVFFLIVKCYPIAL